MSFEKPEFKDKYLDALIFEIKTGYKDEKLNTLYIGGGTPSILSAEDFKKILELFRFEKNAEITTEINPEGITTEYLQKLKKLGINRISIGSQTFDDKILKKIGRRHNAKQIEQAIICAKDAGFKNVSIDLIYGLPSQSLNDFEKDLKKTVSLDIQHISLYGLKIEKGCHFYKSMPKNLPDNDLQADMYLLAIKTLKNSGYNHYEISNFSRVGYESQHNLNYWNNNTYYGFGLNASGYENETRYTNEADLNKYIKSPLEKMNEQKLSEKEILEEEIFLGFRKIAGINIEQINEKFKINFNKNYSKIIDKYLYSKHIFKTAEGYALTTEGILVSNEILSEFI